MHRIRFIAAILLILNSPTILAGADLRVVDGDTIEIDGILYRINGIDAPEHGQTCGDWDCGAEATNAMLDRVKNADVTCKPLGEDGYGRVIATCYANGVDLGKSLVDGGHAWAFLRYSDVYAQDELNAKAKSLGIWSGDYQPPWDYRQDRWESAAEEAPEGCPIKGNISDNGRIYHAPWSPWYSRTRIDTSKGERWFCSEAEARASGWRAPYWN